MPSARRVNWAKFRVGVTSGVALLILGILAYLLTGGTLLQPKTTIRVYAPDASGIAAGSPTRLNGIPVGKVRSVRLTRSRNPDRIVEIVSTVELEHLHEITEDSTAQIGAENVIGDKFLDIAKGTSPRSVKPGGEILFKPAPELLKTLDLAQFEKNLRAIDDLLRDIEEGRTRVGRFVVGEEMYRQVLGRVRELERSMHAATDTNTAVGQLLYTDTAYRKIESPLLELDSRLAAVQSGQGEFGRLLRDSGSYEKARSDIASLRKSIAGIAASELISSDAAYRRWNRKLSGFIQSIEDFNSRPWMTGMSAYESLNGAAREMRSFLSDFRRDPQKYLRLEIF